MKQQWFGLWYFTKFEVFAMPILTKIMIFSFYFELLEISILLPLLNLNKTFAIVTFPAVYRVQQSFKPIPNIIEFPIKKLRI